MGKRAKLTVFALLAVLAPALVLGEGVVVLHLPVPESKDLLNIDVPIDVVFQNQRALDVVIDHVAPRIGVCPPNTQPRLLGVILGVCGERASLFVDVGRRNALDHLVELDASLRSHERHGILSVGAVGHGNVHDLLEVEGRVCGLGTGAPRQMRQLAGCPLRGAVRGVRGTELADGEEKDYDDCVGTQSPGRQEHGRGHHVGYAMFRAFGGVSFYVCDDWDSFGREPRRARFLQSHAQRTKKRRTILMTSA